MPFIQDVIYYEKRVLSLIPQDAEGVILSDQKRLQVDAYARYQIEDPLLFYQTVRSELVREDGSKPLSFIGSPCSRSRNTRVDPDRSAERHHPLDR